MKDNRGGPRIGAGRPTKANELALIERLSPMDEIALKALKIGVSSGDFNFIKLFLEYRYGKPKQDIGLSGSLNMHISDEPIIFE
jgi:hypothetical protein